MSKIIKKIEVVDYDKNWPNLYQVEANKIKISLGDNFINIYHVGSTSVPNLIAKPKIDILAVVKDLSDNQIRVNLEKIGVIYKGEYNIPMRHFFSKRSVDGEIELNLHLYEENHPEINLNLLFRDCLRNNEKACKEYANLKRELLKEKSSFEKNNSIFSGYNLGKNEFITKVLNQAGFKGNRILKATHNLEIRAANNLIKSELSENELVKYNGNYVECFKSDNNIHLIYTKGLEIIAYAHLLYLNKSECLIKRFAFNDNCEIKLARDFVMLIISWLKLNSYERVYSNSFKNDSEVLSNFGFVESETTQLGQLADIDMIASKNIFKLEIIS